MFKPLFTLSFVTSVAFAAPLGHPSGRLSSLIDQAQRRADCVVNLEAAPGLESLEALVPPEEFGKDSLRLRAILPSDLLAVRRAVEIYTDPQVAAMSGDYLDESRVRSLLALGAPRFDDMGRTGLVNFAIVAKTSAGEESIVGLAQAANSDLGVAREKGLVQDRSRWFEISYHLDPQHWGKGIASAAVETLIETLMKMRNAEGIYAQIDINNEKSARVLQRAGFQELERRRFASINGETGTIYFALTRENFENPPLKHGLNVRTFTDERGLKMIQLAIVGQVPRGTVVTIDETTTHENMAYPESNDRLVQLNVRSGATRENFGQYVTVPIGNPFGGPLYTSVLELERLIDDCTIDGKLDRNGFGSSLAYAFRATEMRTLFRALAQDVPVNFASLTVFERRRVYENFAKALKEAKAMLPFHFVVMNAEGVDILSRENVVANLSQDR